MRAPVQGNPVYPYTDQWLADKADQSKRTRAFYRAAVKEIAPGIPGIVVKSHFNPGGIAVWGETLGKFYRNVPTPYYDAATTKNVPFDADKANTTLNVSTPFVEAYDTSMGILVRQWDGKNSGRNHYATDLAAFVALVKQLAASPFKRF